MSCVVVRLVNIYNSDTRVPTLESAYPTLHGVLVVAILEILDHEDSDGDLLFDCFSHNQVPCRSG